MSTLPENVLIAPAAFKGTYPAMQVATFIASCFKEVLPHANFLLCPISDGGDDTLNLLHALQPKRWQWHSVDVMGPTPETQVTARYLYNHQQQAIVIEAAQAHGLVLLREKSPLKATSYGVGELILHAIQQYPKTKSLTVTLGGSASTDGGIGALQALGYQFLNTQGTLLPQGLGGGDLLDICTAVPPNNTVFENLKQFTILTDVSTPLLDKLGSARVFSPQKGASPDQVALLDDGLKHLSQVIEATLPSATSLARAPGSGAAGGLAFGLRVTSPKAQLQPGAAWYFQQTGVLKKAKTADWIITGEGCFDSSSMMGKATGELIKQAVSLGKTCLVICGQLDNEVPNFNKVYFLSLSSGKTCPQLLKKDEIRKTLNHLLGSWFRSFNSP